MEYELHKSFNNNQENNNMITCLNVCEACQKKVVRQKKFGK